MEIHPDNFDYNPAKRKKDSETNRGKTSSVIGGNNNRSDKTIPMSLTDERQARKFL